MDYVLKAYPASSSQHVQTKAFKPEGLFTSEDDIPQNIFFEMAASR